MSNKVYIKKISGIDFPERATEFSAGYDIIAVDIPKPIGNIHTFGKSLEDCLWNELQYIEYNTNLFMRPEDMNNHVDIKPRSSISNKTNLILANSIGTIDGDYLGMYICRFRYIFQPLDYQIIEGSIVGKINRERAYHTGDKIAQIMLQPNFNMDFEFVNELPTTERGSGGFGSTDIGIS